MEYTITFNLRVADYDDEYARQAKIHVGASDDALRKHAILAILSMPEAGILSMVTFAKHAQNKSLHVATLVFTDYEKCYEPLFFAYTSKYCEARKLPAPALENPEEEEE